MRRLLQLVGSIYGKVAFVGFPLVGVCLLPSIYFSELLPRALFWQEFFQEKSSIESAPLAESALEPEWTVFVPPRADFEFEFDVNGIRSVQVLHGLDVARKAAPQSRVVVLVDGYSAGNETAEVFLIPPTKQGHVLKLSIHNLYIMNRRSQSGSVLAMR